METPPRARRFRHRARSGREAGPRVLVINAYSTLNIGDALILSGLLAALREAGAGQITVAAPAGRGEPDRRMALGADEIAPMAVDVFAAPAFVRRIYPFIGLWTAMSIAITAVRAVLAPASNGALRAYVDAELVVSSGGAYIGGRRPGINLLTAFQIFVARIVGRPCIVAPVTVTPMSRPVATILSLMLHGATVFARDIPTAGRLRSIGISARVSSDLAFQSPVASHARPRRPPSREMIIAWAPRQFAWDSEVYATRGAVYAAAAGAMTAITREHDARLVLVTQSTADGIENDVPAVRRAVDALPRDVRARTEFVRPQDVAHAMRTYAMADVVYAFRMHAALMALLAGTPTLVVPYEAKVRGVFELLGLGDWVISRADAVDSARVATRLLEMAHSDPVHRIETALRAARELHEPFLSELRVRFAPSRSG